ncbi:hypothetical protein DEO72_LG2g1704 [Vigna unguiculata]|uniref:Uncharacterized protein n=1 Tax=Vigna unguiculata TaxID=3917 RepID=A0A4D6KYI9_VIGUN|nr:hypothetical protein DEO72_LG2g1702 [Vigna unguiculata]QCD81379.1 hypothetical protein DEO72_LG2g1704 [Vigna unguiculata]
MSDSSDRFRRLPAAPQLHCHGVAVRIPRARPQDLFHTPPEAATDGDGPYAVNHAADVDAGTNGLVDLCEGSELVDLGRDSELGFPEVQRSKKLKVSEVDLGMDST